MSVLSKSEIQSRLKGLRDWSQVGNKIQRKYSFKTFMSAIAFVNKTAEAAEKAQHHPDITVNYNVVTISLSTHSEGGITGKDFDLAKQIDQVFEMEP